MIRRQRIDKSRTNRFGHTLVELTISMSLATLLMLGLCSALLISTRVFDGQRGAHIRSRAAEVQGDMLKDLRQATGFTTKTATSVTFTVPDRDGNTLEETITYDWDSGNAELNYIYNGSPAETLLTDVNSFDLSYLTRSLTGSTPALPPLDPNSWGTRWGSGYSIFGYENLFVESAKSRKTQIGTRATLTEAGTVQNIIVYVEVPPAGMQLTAAIYNVDGSGEPSNLMVASGNETVLADGWYTLAVTPTSLPAGDYFLALAYDDKNGQHFFDSGGSSVIRAHNNDAVTNGWAPNWGPPIASAGTLSIYAEYVPD